MTQNRPTTMKAMVLNEFGGVEKLTLQDVPVPEMSENEVVMRVEIAGVGEWDPFEREGGYAEIVGTKPSFPYILGSEGAGEVMAVGEQVKRLKPGDPVYASAFLNPKGGFYAEYAVVEEGLVMPIPPHLTVEQAGVMSGVGVTALRGLDDTLHLKGGESLLIFGAGGGIGHIAVQLAKRMGARVFAVASGGDGVTLAKELGAEVAADGHEDDMLVLARAFAPDGFDAALLTAGGEAAEKALNTMGKDGRVAFPKGIDPEPQARLGIEINGYNGEPDPDIVERFNRLIGDDAFAAHVAQTFPLEQAADAHRALDEHYLGKIALRVG